MSPPRDSDLIWRERLRNQALSKWRGAKAGQVRGMTPEGIVSTRKLRLIAEKNPATLKELQELGAFPDLWIAAFGDEVLAVLRKQG